MKQGPADIRNNCTWFTCSGDLVHSMSAPLSYTIHILDSVFAYESLHMTRRWKNLLPSTDTHSCHQVNSSVPDILKAYKLLILQTLNDTFLSLTLLFSTDETVFLTLRLLMSYIYGSPILDVSRSHTTTQHSR